MPPRAKYTKEQIIDAAFCLVREKGMAAFTARSLAERLGVSTAPIFTAFETMEEVQNEVIQKAKDLYADYLRKGLAQPPAFKNAGLQYIQFAKDEPELFKLLFMTNRGCVEFTHYLPACDENSAIVLHAAMDSYGLSEEKARRIYNHLAVYLYGIAVLCAQKSCMFTMDDISRMLSELFMALKRDI